MGELPDTGSSGCKRRLIQEIIDIGKWSVHRTGVSLLRLKKLFEVGL